MSEPTYRVDLTNHPAEMYHWRAEVVRLSDDHKIKGLWGDSRQEAFESALRFVVALKEPEHSSSVYLSEDGDLIDSAEVQL